jgi:hypothetical protein
MLKVLVPSIAVLELQIVFEESPQSQWVLWGRYLSTSGLRWNSGDLLKRHGAQTFDDPKTISDL